METTNKFIISPIFEKFYKYSEKNIHCSIDSCDDSVPVGSKNYFNRHGYLVIANLFDPNELYEPVSDNRGMIKYHGSLDKFTYEENEGQVPGSFSRYSHPRYKEVHNKIRLILQDAIGEELYNTYYYDRFYFAGQELTPHKDRDSCEISVTVQISNNTFEPWPLYLQRKDGKNVGINLQNGWGIVYMGCDVLHWRDPLKSRYNKLGKLRNKVLNKKDDTYHHQIFFHYVRANGTRAHHFNDTINP
jgi:hypothetical protein